jgi:hypothetical protein
MSADKYAVYIRLITLIHDVVFGFVCLFGQEAATLPVLKNNRPH